MRLLLADPPVTGVPPVGSPLSDDELARVYAAPAADRGWLRVNFATSIDGRVTGSDGRSGSVNSDADHVVFELLRALSDVVVVGAGTIRAEGYGPLAVDGRWADVRRLSGLAPLLPLVVVSRSAAVPTKLVGAPAGLVLLATRAAADDVDRARGQLRSDNVLVCGDEAVDVRSLLAQLHDRGWTRVLSEGGPHLLASFLDAEVVDELCLSITPRLVGGDGPRLTPDALRDDDFVPRVLVEEGGTLIGRWLR